MTDSSDDFGTIRDRLLRAAKDHSPRIDSMYYNGGTVLVLAATAAATFITGNPAVSNKVIGAWLPPLLTGFATFWVALERALSFGARWRFHTEMKQGYESVIDMIDFYNATRDKLSADDESKYSQDIWRMLYELRRREASIPGSGIDAKPS